MNIKIGDKVPPQFVDTYVVNMRFMHGDADHYEDIPYPVKDVGELEALIQSCDWSITPYRDREECSLYLAPMFPYKEEMKEDDDWKYEHVPRDITCWDYEARLDSYKLFYYDKEGIPYKVIYEG